METFDMEFAKLKQAITNIELEKQLGHINEDYTLKKISLHIDSASNALKSISESVNRKLYY